MVGSKLLVWGGFGQWAPGHIDWLGDGAIYDASTDTWAKMPAPPVQGLRSVCAAVVEDGRLVVIGRPPGSESSRTGMVYHLDSGTWETMAAAPFDVGAGAACAASRDRIAVWSGGRTDGVPGAVDAGAVYDFWTRAWQKLPDAPVPPRMLSFARCDGRAFVVWGGWVERRGVRVLHGWGVV